MMGYSFFHSLFQLVEEKCVYRPSEENGEQTVCERHGFVTSSIFGFGRALQAIGIDRFKKGIQKTVIGYEYVLEKMYSKDRNGITIPDPASTQTHKLTSAEKIKSTAQKAKDIAKSKASRVVVTN